METVKIGDQFDSLRARDSSTRWRVIRIDPTGSVHLECVGRRVGPPPPIYTSHRRDKVPGKFIGWELEPMAPPLKHKIVHLDVLLRASDYERVENGDQPTLLGMTI